MAGLKVKLFINLASNRFIARFNTAEDNSSLMFVEHLLIEVGMTVKLVLFDTRYPSPANKTGLPAWCQYNVTI